MLVFISAEVFFILIKGFQLTMDPSASGSPSAESIQKILEGQGLQLKDLRLQTNLDAFVTFQTLHYATLAQHSVEDGSITIDTSNDGSSPAARLFSAVTSYPANAVAVEDFSEDTPASEITEFLKQHDIKPISLERKAILKFKRHMEVHTYLINS